MILSQQKSHESHAEENIATYMYLPYVVLSYCKLQDSKVAHKIRSSREPGNDTKHATIFTLSVWVVSLPSLHPSVQINVFKMSYK